MDTLSDNVEIQGLPPYVESWAVAKVAGFVPAILKRWLRSHPDLPTEFYLVMCPVAEVNTLGGLPARVHLLTDPRLTCRHFTGCSRPYYAMIFTGPDADARRAEMQTLLPWSESYTVDIKKDPLQLIFIDASEDIDSDQRPVEARRVADLLESGELLKIM